MPTWSEILEEIKDTQLGGKLPPNFDAVRRKYLAALYQHSNRNVILYAAGWVQKPDAPPGLTSINDEDLHAFMEVTHGLKGGELDLILHSPGGSSEAAEAIVSYLRSRFSHIRVIVPHLAMSAATMIACAADEIVLGKHSFLGPIDPQFLLPTPLGIRMVPAQAILDQFDQAIEASKDPQKIQPWIPILPQYGPDVLIQCESALEMTKSLVGHWLEEWMFKTEPDPSDKAQRVSEWLADHTKFKSHSRHISRAEIEKNELKIAHMENDHQFQDLALSTFHATSHIFAATPVVKIVENQHGRAFIRQLAFQHVPIPPTNPSFLEIPISP